MEPAMAQSRRFLDLFSVAGKTVLVSGGSSGLGYAMAQAYLESGGRVYITGRKPEPLEAARAALAAHGHVRAIQGDVATPEGLEAIRSALAGEDRLHVLVNNAGITWGASLEKFPAEAWDSVMGVNVKAPFLLVQALVGKLQAAATEDDPARVINVGSIYGVTSQVLRAWSYAASKAAVHQLTKVLAAELAARRILVNAIAPGFFPSKMTHFIASDEGRMDEMRKLIPLGRAGTPDDIGALAIYLGSRASSYMTGNVIPLDGGVLAKL
jgi:NAD(P)-dependent dehydrogenase (short-subunit alcohol dehydrogenase family)